MRILVLSDIHANLDALEAVVSDAGEFDNVWCLGDVVGYGPDPNETIEYLFKLPNVSCLMGNHDAAALDRLDMSNFNREARIAIEWTRDQLTPANRSLLDELPTTIETELVTLAHGSPRHPLWEYLTDTRSATSNFGAFKTPYCFVGHTHLPVIYNKPEEHLLATLTVPYSHTQVILAPRSIVNPGSVGQPRDRDPKASYAIYKIDDNLWEFHRVEYDIPAVQARMEAEGLSRWDIERLAIGR